MFVSRLLVLLSPPFSVFATRKEMEKHNATPRRKGESPKKEEERGQSKVGGPSSHFCVVLLFSPLSFRVVLLGVVMLSHRSLVWRFFPFLGGAVFSFGWCCFPPSFGWCCFLRPFRVYCLVFFLLVLLPPSTRAGVLLSPPPPLSWCCFPLLGGAAFSSLFFWVVLLSPFLLFRLVVLCPLPLFLGPLGGTAWSAPSGGAAFLSLIRVVLISPSPPATIKLASRGQSTQVTTDRQHTFVLHLRERELLTSIGRSLHEFPLCVSSETTWTANLQRVVATSSSERSEGGRLGEAETLAQFQAFLDKKILPAEERVRCVRLVEVWNIVKSPRHPSLVLACPHEQIQDEDGIGEEAVKNLDKRTSGSNQRTERFLERPKSS